MIARYNSLAQRVRTEVAELDRTQGTIVHHWERFQASTSDQDAFLSSVALGLHNLYAGLERVFELIAAELDGGVLGSDSWHTDLLRQMSLNLPSIRLPVLQPGTARRLDEYRKFRHLVQDAYAFNLDPARVGHLVDDLPDLWRQLRLELVDFSQFLERRAYTDPG